jgi:NADPH:quinone reductase
MVQVVRIHEPGGPDKLKVEDVELAAPGPGEIRLAQTAIGLNFIDTYQRSGLYPVAPPVVLGMEAAGVVEALGEGVAGLKQGDRVAYPMQMGAYAAARNVPADRVIKIPDGIDDQTAAAMMLKGMTVEYLLERCFQVRRGQTILFHAAAGGVGLIACQWAKTLGATVIGTVSTPQKAELAKAHGCDHALDSTSEDIAARVKEITDGKGVPVVYDSIGRDTFQASMASLAPRGMFVSFGQSSGPVASFDPGLLAQGGSLYYTRPSLGNYIATRDDLEQSGRRLTEMVGSGKVKINVNQSYKLADIVQAHKDLEGRKTTGSTVLLP